MAKDLFKSSVYAAGRRSAAASWVANMAAHTFEAIRFFPARFADHGLEYASSDNVIGSLPGHAHLNDIPLNFFARSILEHDYQYVIEIGSYSLERIRRLAMLFPTKKFFALDIGFEYITERTIDRVTLMPNNLTNISFLVEKQTGRGLLISHGTLAYYPLFRIEALIEQAAQLHLDIALAEPNGIGENSRNCSLQRTRKSWHHPYLSLLRANGFTMPDSKGHQVGGSFSTFGEWHTYIFATQRSTT